MTNESPARARHRRARILSAVLAPYGLTASEAGTGRHVIVSDRKGMADVAAGLPAIWQAADRMSAGRIDALDPMLLEALSSRSAEGTRP